MADRHDKRLMMLIGDLGATLGLLFIFFMMLKGNIQLWQIYLGITISSTFSAFQDPAYKALVTDFIPKAQYAKASGLLQLASSAQYLISPFLAGILLTIIDIKFIFVIDVTTFLFAGVIIIWIRRTLGTTKTKQPKQNNQNNQNKTLLLISKKVCTNFLKIKVSFG